MNKMSYKDLDDQQMQQLSRLKELLCGIVDGAKDVETEPSRIVEQVGLQDAKSSNVILFFFLSQNQVYNNYQDAICINRAW